MANILPWAQSPSAMAWADNPAIASPDNVRQLLGWLGDRESQLELAVEAANLGLWHWNPKTGELVWSDRCRSLIGVEPDVRPDFDVFMAQVLPEDRTPLAHAVQAALTTGGSYSQEFRVVLADGTIRWLHTMGRAELSAITGAALRMSGVVRDMTVAKESGPGESMLRLQKGAATGRIHERIRELARRSQGLRDLDRTETAGRLQEGIYQDMTELSMSLQELAGTFGSESSLRLELERLFALADNSLDSLRRVVFDLMPPSIRELGFEPGIRRYAAELAEQHGLQCQMRFPEEPIQAPQATLAVLYAVAQEALKNCVKHARATRVDLFVDNPSGHVLMRIADNGVGITPIDRDKPGHLGLIEASERVVHIGGTLSVFGIAGGGTTVEAKIPVASDSRLTNGEGYLL